MGNYNTLGERIKSLRQSLGFSQADLAKQLNCTQAALSQYECGNREPSLRDLVNIANKLNTSTDYLLGITHVATKDTDVKMVADYLGLTEEAICNLHTHYWRRKEKTQEEYICEEVRLVSGASLGDETYEMDYNFIFQNRLLALKDYTKFINEFICSSAFGVLEACLINNLYLERVTFDLLKVAAKEYAEIENPFAETDIAKIAYSLVEDSEDNIRQYSLNLFDAQTAVIDFCKDFTQLEEIKKLEYSEEFYRKLSFFIYYYTRPMFESDNFSAEDLEKGLADTLTSIMPQVLALLEAKKEKNR